MKTPLPLLSLPRSGRSAGWLAAAWLLCGVAQAQLVDISNAPLYGGRQAHPNVAVTMSVEFPTVGAAYNQKPYITVNPYVGYFDNTRCYTYTSATGGYFFPSGTADANHFCSGQFSGNFMNYVTMSAIDEFRYAMTGGNRDVENGPNGGTIIQRAYLPDGSVSGVPDFYGYDYNFPRVALYSSYTGQFYSYGNWDYGTLTYGAPGSSLLPWTNADSTTQAIFVYNCKTKVYFSVNFGGNCSYPQDDLYPGGMNVRINVCDSGEGPVRTDLCLQYGGSTGPYKPVGQTQLNASKMRFAAFGYLMDRNNSGYSVPPYCDDGLGWSRCRYGGVLRAPMTYVGPYTYDANQVQSTNTHAEIDSVGQFVADPEGTAASAGGSYSGVINYINRFGASGVYKRYDPAGEMFYEAIRYYENLGPTDLATCAVASAYSPSCAGTTINNTVLDNFPITTTWTDPIGSICSQNYIINLSDANTWDDTYLPGYGGSGSIGPGYGRPSYRAPDPSGLDAVDWTNRIGYLESNTPSIVANDVRPNLANLPYQTTGGTGTSAFFVAGAAYWANVNDIRSDLAGKQTIKTISFDVAEPSTDIHDRALYLMGKYGGFNNTIDRTVDTYANPFYATDPMNVAGPAIRSNAEWADSTNLPTNYLLASDPSKLINGLRAAFARINAQTGTLSGAALTSANLTFGSAGAYVATFDPARWAGSVLFDSLSVDMYGNLVVSSSPIWDSGALLTTRCGSVASGSTVCTDTDTSANRRKIFTTINVSGVRTPEPFTFTGISTDAAYTTALGTNPTTHVVDSLTQQRINYLRGYRADEGSSLQFRLRDSAMGDVVNSGPVYEGAPAAGIPDASYQAFYLANASRTPAVYVGANDGMLHAFRASDGFELFAYIPGYESSYLNDLTDPGYQHEVFVDTVPRVQEVYVNSTWKTVLVGANGNGSQGIFGLDVTDPTAFGTTSVLFEFTDADDADLGNVVATPEIAKIQVGGTAASPIYRYFAVVTSYNKTRTASNGHPDTNVSADTTNKAVLFLIALDHTLGNAWVLNTDYYKFSFPASNATLPNGLAPATLLLSKSGDLSTSFMYFGDLQGNLWKFDTSLGSPSSWKPVLGTVASPQPIFVAQDSLGNRQPITSRVELAGGPFGSTLVFFGTGEYLGASDLALPASVQSEYSLLDVNPSVLITRSSDLVARTGTISGSNVLITGASFSYSGTSAKKGWYFDFPSSVTLGERSVTKPAIRTGLLTFTTLTLSNDLCTPGNGYIYQVDALSGLPFPSTLNPNVGGYASTVGIPGPPRVVDLTITGGQTAATGEVINRKTQTTLVSGTSGRIGGFGDQSQRAMPPTQEINWREITNYNDRTGH